MGREPSAADLAFVSTRRVGRLATAGPSGRPAVVPFCYAVIEHEGKPVIVSALDEKPKSVPLDQLQRVRNILANPTVNVVVDDYSEDWSRLRFVQITGRAVLIEQDQPRYLDAIVALRSKYPQYERMAIERAPVLWIDSLEAVSWRSDVEASRGDRSNDLIASIQGRRSVRALLPTPAPRELIEQAIAAAGWAPSPHGRQPWRFAVIEALARKEHLVEAMSETWRQQLELDGQDAAIVAIRLEKSRQRLLEAPLIVVPCLYLGDLDVYPDKDRQNAERTMAIQSLGAAIQNLMLSLYSSGLDSGWMCAPLFCPEVVRDALCLDSSLIPQALLPVGYAAKDPVRRPRLPVDTLIADWS